jgi:RHS repeat-associated protein
VKFEAVAGHGYVIELSQESGATIYYNLYNAAGTALVSNQSGAYEWTCPATGTYYLRFWADDYLQYTSCRFRILPAYWNNFASWGRDYEPNDQGRRACYVCTDDASPFYSVVHARSEVGSDLDWYRLYAVAGASYTITLLNEIGGNFYFRIYNPSFASISSDITTTLTWVCPATGIYHVRVWEQNTDQVGGYDLKIVSVNGKPADADSDADGMPDCWELYYFGNGNLYRDGTGDYDGDGVTDKQEYDMGTVPAEADNDSDGDGIPDNWENLNGLNASDPTDGIQDYDNDGLINLFEFTHKTNPFLPDTDGDGIPDGWEVTNGLQPKINDGSLDSDQDGLTNYQEFLHQTIPLNPDTDGDGVTDGQEVANGTNPRAFTSALKTDVTQLPLSVGSEKTVVLNLYNNTENADTFDFSIQGIPESWYILSQNRVTLAAGEMREIELDLQIPQDCSIGNSQYTVAIGAVSVVTGPVANGGVTILLQVQATPVISLIYPQANEVIASNSLSVTWQTDIEATSVVYYRMLGATEYQQATGLSGKAHQVVLTNLAWDRAYQWYVSSAAGCTAANSTARTVFVQDAVAFANKQFSFTIARDYDQQVQLTIVNRDYFVHNVLVQVINPYDDLVAGFVGSGSSDEIVSLNPGEQRTVTLALHAPDSRAHTYSLTIKAITDADSSNAMVDYAVAEISIPAPVFDLEFIQVASDPATFTNTFRLTNRGDTLTDLTVSADEVAGPQISFHPQIEHHNLAAGASIEFKARFSPTVQNPSFVGQLMAESAGRYVGLTTSFACAPGKDLYSANLSNFYICPKSVSWYCTNKPLIRINLDLPPGLNPSAITRARLYGNFSLRSPIETYRNHTVEIFLNDVLVDTLSNTVPRGPYALEINPALLQTGSQNSKGRNQITLKTTHMNGGHYAVATAFQLVVDVGSMSLGPMCTASQEEADQKVASLPFICSGPPSLQPCPAVDSIAVLDQTGKARRSFSKGESVQVQVLVSNPDLEVRNGSATLTIDDDFNSGGAAFTGTESYSVQANGAVYKYFNWTIPLDAQVQFFDVRASVDSTGGCADQRTASKAIALNQPVVGMVMDNETGAGLAGATVCAYVAGPNGLDLVCTTTDASGQYSLQLPVGNNFIFAWKDGYSWDSGLIDTGAMSPVFGISRDSTNLGNAPTSGHMQDPVTTSIGNFTLESGDIGFKSRGLNVAFSRFYNSLDTYQGPLGYGWTHSYNVGLKMESGTAIIKFADGREEIYVERQDGSFRPQPGVHSTLTQASDGSYILEDKRQIKHHFDAAGRLLKIEDRNGNAITLTYQNGLLAQITDPVGRQLGISYDASSRITQVQDPIGRILTYQYDAGGNLAAFVDAAGSTTSYTYDANHQLLTATDPKGNVFVSNTYDSTKRVVTAQSDALGNVSRFEYDDENRITTIIDPLGNKTVHYHDSRNRLTKVVDPLRREMVHQYDEENNRIRTVDKRGSQTLYAYDDRANVLQVTDALNQVTAHAYDIRNNPTQKIDAQGNVTRFEYDANGNLVKTIDALLNETAIQVNAFGQPTRITDALGRNTLFTYDGQGNLSTRQDALGFITTHGYDGVSRLVSQTDALGRTRHFEYDARDRLIESEDPAPFNFTVVNAYDANGNRISTQDRLGNKSTFAYDQKDRLQSVTDPLLHTVTHVYDALDRKISQTDQRGKITTFEYDALGKLIRMTDPLGNSFISEFDENGNLLRKTDPTGNRVSNAYDVLNRLISEEDTLGNRTQYQYDALGRMTAKIDAKGRITSYGYDALGRLVSVTEPTGGITQYEYDAAGNKTRMINALGNAFTYEYDALNRLIRDADGYRYSYDGVGNLIERIDAKNQAVAYTYDALNRMTSITYPDATSVSYNYDANGNLVSMLDSIGATGNSYDALNRLDATTDPFGNTVGYVYDPAGNLVELIYPDDTSVTYAFDDANRLASVTDWSGRIVTYSYDSAGKLVRTNYPNGTSATYTYDAAARLRGLSNKKQNNEVICSYNYTLDQVGNRVAVDKIEPLVPFIKTETVNYQYEADNRIASISNGSFAFDANGSVIQKTENAKTLTYEWNYENYLKQWGDGVHTSTYGYDGLKRRLTAVRNGVATRYVLDTHGELPYVLAETDSTAAIKARYIYGIGLIAREDSSGVKYYHYDPLGSTIALSNETGIVTDKYAYAPFGELSNRGGYSDNSFEFIGQFGLINEGDGIYNVRARYYDSKTGRFLSKDLANGSKYNPKNLHRYSYTNNRPHLLIDINGYCPKKPMTQDEFALGMVGAVFELGSKIFELGPEEWILIDNQKMPKVAFQAGAFAKILEYSGNVLTLYEFFKNIYDESDFIRNGDISTALAVVTSSSWNAAISLFNFEVKLITKSEIDLEFSAEEIHEFAKDPVTPIMKGITAWRYSWSNLKWAFGFDE